MEYVVLSIILALVLYLVCQWLSATAKRKELTLSLRVFLVEIEQAETAFATLHSYSSGYFNNFKAVEWMNRYHHVHDCVKDLPFETTLLTMPEKEMLRCFLDHRKRLGILRDAFNYSFVQQELQAHQAFFSDIEGRSLDVQQRTAIVSDEDNSLIVAGAGSGKTTTIVGKVAYVQKRYRTDPRHILLISFTNKSATQLQERMGNDGIVPRTFHKFGKDIICAVEGKQPSLYDETQFPQFIRATFQALMKEPAYAHLVTTYFVQDLKPEKERASFRNQGDYIQHLKDSSFRPYKRTSASVRGKTTLRREVVKSVEEYHIANFLLFNGVDYLYEAPYEHATADKQYAQWKPDFTIVQDDQRLYLEHFGIDREGNVPAFFAKPGQTVEQARARYTEKIAFARRTTEANGTVLLESYSYEMAKRTLFANLTEQLTRHGIRLTPKTPEEIWNIIVEAAEEEVKGFHTLLQTFITLLKSNNYTMEQVRAQVAKGKETPTQQRNRRFLDIVEPLYGRYQQELAKRKEIDFSDLINLATDYLERGSYRQRFDYIVIDEFQDISKDRYRLLQALKGQNPSCKLFCVGDDWQSIYRFTGSDIALFKEFEQYFGVSLHAKIETTYRFHEPLISRSSAFIMRNPNQTPKVLRSAAQDKQTQYRIAYSTDDQDDTAALQHILDALIAEVPDISQKELLLLGRYGFDQDRIRNTSRVFGVEAANKTFTYPYRDGDDNWGTLRVPFMTVHKAKGLEADIVIVLNCNSGKFGFPSEMSDDPVLNLLLSEADQFENGEERRLFYVAMTRAKERVILVADATHKSKFIMELEVGDGQAVQKKCPLCVTADTVLRTGIKNGKPWAFYGCINHQYGCEYQEWVRITPSASPLLPTAADVVIEKKVSLPTHDVKPLTYLPNSANFTNNASNGGSPLDDASKELASYIIHQSVAYRAAMDDRQSDTVELAAFRNIIMFAQADGLKISMYPLENVLNDLEQVDEYRAILKMYEAVELMDTMLKSNELPARTKWLYQFWKKKFWDYQEE